MSDIQRAFKGNLGLFLVCAELSKRNLIALPTSRNTKGYDVVVMNPDTGVAAGVQVKCTDQPGKGFPILSTHWGDYEKKIDEKILCDLVLVNLSNADNPTYYVASRQQAKNLLKSSIEGYIIKRMKKLGLTREQMLDKEKNEKRNPDLNALSLDEIEPYKDKWEIIVDSLSM